MSTTFPFYHGLIKLGKISMETHSRRGLRKANVNADRDLWLWYCSLETKVPRKAVQEKAKLIFKESGIPNFKASDGWYRRWINHWKTQSICESESNCSLGQFYSSLCDSGQSVEKNDHVGQTEQSCVTESLQAPKISCCAINVNNTEKETNVPHVSTNSSDVLGSTSQSECNLKDKINDIHNFNSVLGQENVFLPNTQVPSHAHNFEMNESAVCHCSAVPVLDTVQRTNLESVSNELPDSCTSISNESLSVPVYNLNDNTCFIGNSYEIKVGYECKFSHEIQNNDSNLCAGDVLLDKIECPHESNIDVAESSLENVNDFFHNVMSDVSLSFDKQMIFNSSAKIVEQPQNGTADKCTVLNEDHKIIESQPTCKQAKCRKKGERYLPKFKEKVLAYALNHSYKDTAKKFKVNHATISMWKKEKINRKLLITGNYKKRLPSGKTSIIPDSAPGQDFIRWLSDYRLAGKTIKYDEIREKARQIVSQNTQLKKPSWFQLWVERYYFCIIYAYIVMCSGRGHLVFQYKMWGDTYVLAG